MKYLLITIAAVVLVGCGKPENSRFVPLQDIPENVRGKLSQADIAELERAKQERLRVKKQTKPNNIHDDAFWGKTEFVRQHLVNGVDVNLKDKDGNTPLHKAAWGGARNKDIVVLLIEKGGDINARTDKLVTPLHASIGAPEISKILIENGADISAKGRFDSTPLHKAAAYDEVETIEILISKGADVNQLAGRATPLDEAIEGKATEAIKLLLKHGGKTSKNRLRGVPQKHTPRNRRKLKAEGK